MAPALFLAPRSVSLRRLLSERSWEGEKEEESACSTATRGSSLTCQPCQRKFGIGKIGRPVVCREVA